MSKAATIKERNALFSILQNQLNRGQGVAIYGGHTFERAAREFEAEGLVTIEDSGQRAGEVLRVVRTF